MKLVYCIISFCMSLKPNINQVYNNAPVSPDKLSSEYIALAALWPALCLNELLSQLCHFLLLPYISTTVLYKPYHGCCSIGTAP